VTEKEQKMMANCRVHKLCLRFLHLALIAFVLGVVMPGYIGGVYYSMCGEHPEEQTYLDRCIAHLRDMRAVCDDPDLQDILDYTIRRYHKIGPWDVMIFPLTIIPRAGGKVVGCNEPFCPGMTLDPIVLLESPEFGALVIVHEAMHDYFPYYGHARINAREKKFWGLSSQVPRQPYPVH
jgi:hypothetical protein